jgi:hypothetical protein
MKRGKRSDCDGSLFIMVIVYLLCISYTIIELGIPSVHNELLFKLRQVMKGFMDRMLLSLTWRCAVRREPYTEVFSRLFFLNSSIVAAHRNCKHHHEIDKRRAIFAVR